MLSCISPENYELNLDEIKNLGIPFPEGFRCWWNKESNPSSVALYNLAHFL